jgi:hypothetical protein
VPSLVNFSQCPKCGEMFPPMDVFVTWIARAANSSLALHVKKLLIKDRLVKKLNKNKLVATPETMLKTFVSVHPARYPF